MRAIIDSDSLVYAVGFASQAPYFLVFHDSEPDMPVAQFDTREEARLFAERAGTGFSCQKFFDPESVGIAHSNTDRLVERIIEGSGADEFELWLTAPDIENNFRYQIDPEYKGNRKDFIKPYHYETIRERLIDKWAAQIAPIGIEADDMVSIRCYEEPYDAVCASIDKDLDQVVGWRYSWETHNKPEQFYFVTDEDARKNYWTQVLTGDRIDNVPGIPRIGPKRAASILQQCRTDRDYYEACKKQYEANGISLERMHKNCKLLYLPRSEDDEWTPPTD